MSAVNATNTTTGRYNPPSAERKLEKQLAQARANQNSLSTTPGNWVVKKDPKLGTFFVLMLGESGADHANHLVIHRLIGQDYKINKRDAWIMSLASDIPGFLENAEFGGKQKVVKLLKTLKGKTAVEAGKLIIEPDGTERYPNGTHREEVLELAREASDSHAKVLGGTHFGEWILYMPPDLVKAEMDVQSTTRGNPEYLTSASRILSEFAVFRTSLIDGSTQKEVPYLYGVPEKAVQRTVYSALFGVIPPTDKPPDPFKSGVMPHKVYSNYKAGGDSARQNLVRLLKVHAEARKSSNIAKSDMDSAKVKEKKTEATKAFDSAKEDLADITSRILLAEKEGKYPTVDAKTHFEIAINSEMSPTQLRETLTKAK